MAAALIALAALFGVWLHDFLSGERLLDDLFDEVRLACTSLRAAEAKWKRKNKTDLVISLTTIPSRLPFLSDTLKSLLLQTTAPARIVLCLPERSLREDCDYVLPETFQKLCALEIARVDDHGPATKLLPMLARSEPNARIVVVDDDRIYPPTFLADIDAASRAAPECALAFSGWLAPKDLLDRPTTLWRNVMRTPPAPLRAPRLCAPARVDIIQGYAGYLVRPRFFDLDAVHCFDGAPKEARLVDDVWFSAHCRAPKHVIPAARVSFQPKRRAFFYIRTSLGKRNRGDGSPASRPNTIMLRYFSDRWLCR